MTTQKAEWQLVLIMWGTKYSIGEVKYLISQVKKHSTRPFRTVFITDRIHEDMDEDVLQKRIPEFYDKPEMKFGGCLAKTSMFQKGVVPDDLPCVYIDIDTTIFGDMSKFLELPKDDKGVVIFQSTLFPIGALGRLAYKLTNGKKYGRGNSSIIVYHPRECSYIDEKFRELIATVGHKGIRPMEGGERFLSWAAQAHLQAHPKSLAVKFPTEFMLYWKWLMYLRASMPWVRKRWDGLVAVTLPGGVVSGKNLLEFEEGYEVVDRKKRRLVWSERTLGSMKQRLIDYYRDQETELAKEK